MSFIRNAKIKTKILAVLVPMSFIGIGGVSYVAHELKHTDEIYAGFVTEDGVASVLIARANIALQASAHIAYQVMAYDGNSPEMPGLQKEYDEFGQEIENALERVKVLTPEAASTANDLIARAREVRVLTDEAVQLGVFNVNDGKAKERLAEADKLTERLHKEIRDWNDARTSALKVQSDELMAGTQATIVSVFSVLGLAFLGCILASLFISTCGITGPIERLRSRMLALAEGDVDQVIEGLERKDEVGQMAAAVAVFRDNAKERQRLEQEAEAGHSISERERIERDELRAKDAANLQFAMDELASGLGRLAAGDVAVRLRNAFVPHMDRLRVDFNASVDKLQQALQTVHSSANGINAGANEMRSSADDFAKRTEQQAAFVEETAAALEEITMTVKDSARRAEEVGTLVACARTDAKKSETVVCEAIDAMQRIERSSTEIANIIGVIDEIAFQTNLLALNAGVEAARAGEAGKGFAVVAQEVRELAQRSASSAREIKTLIGTSGDQVRAGVKLVRDTGAALTAIAGEIEGIDTNIVAIVEAAREQSVALQDINRAVNSMDQGTQQNAAMVEQATAATHSLSQEAASLTRLLGQFNLGGVSVASPVKTTPKPIADARLTLSPERPLPRRLANAFPASGAAARQAEAGWEEF